MKIIILTFCFLFAIQAICLSQTYPNEREVRAYQEIISLYPPDLVTGFPDKVESKIFAIMGLRFPRGKYMNFIHVALYLDNNEIKILEMILAAKAERIYHITYSCLMVIPYNYSNFEIIESDSLRNCRTSNILPIPNFKCWEVGFPLEFFKNKDSKIYVLDAKKGRFLEDDNLSKSGVGLPKEWLHGYTKGVTIFKNYAIYWLEVW